MNCKITRNAAKIILHELEKEENKDLKLRVFITHSHGDHAHYGMDLTSKFNDNDDAIIQTDKNIDVVLSKNEPLLDGVKVDYLYFPQEGFVITNPSKGNHGDH